MRGRPVGTGWHEDEPVPAHKLDIVYESGTTNVAVCRTPPGAPSCPWRHEITYLDVWTSPGHRQPRLEPFELTSYHHWMHQLDELRKAGL